MSALDTAEEYARDAYPRLARLARSLTHDWAEAEDLVQTTLTKTFVAWRKVAAADDPDAYVRRIMLNVFFSERRRGWFRRERQVEDLGRLVDVSQSAAPSPAESWEDHEAMIGLFARLPKQQRAVLALRYLEDCPDEQIADLLGCSRQAVASAAYRGLRQLREHLVTPGSELRTVVS